MKRLSLLFLAFVVSGCVHRVAVRPNIEPSALVAEKLPYSVAVVFSEQLKTYKEQATPSSSVGMEHRYDFEIGSAICGALTRSVEVAYEDVVETETSPEAGDYDRIISFSLQDSNIDVYFQEAFLTPTARADYSVSITMEAYDGETMELVQRGTISGSGFSARRTDEFSAQKEFVKAIEDAIQQVSDDAANLLVSGFAEPK